ncbi:methyltransferase [Virgisporangium ochraceum]|uniref:50S ribosomal protein L11 methyltransferase n=1 Tax=Virgisporangium ochraceum TaxID=65505 RepID=A0A8J3ZZF9_9ACTN|nr:50S ribosomal protein L11 methyltransferase [Virgisporangium ochraceum]GIJ71048.1 50S ribosomal protein L11 methyltransferase [Virgisporangium ochraceum]
MTTHAAQAYLDLEREVATRGSGLDRLHLVEVPFVPEVRLHLAEDPTVWWARMEARADARLAPPYWASAWAGGRAVARYVLDHPETVAGRRVLDLAAGSGLVAIAAGLAGATKVVANDVDPYAIAAITLNAKANDVAVTECHADLLDGDDGCGADAQVVLAGDVFYDDALAGRMLAFLDRMAARGAVVLVGDPGRGHVPEGRFQTLETYPLPRADAFADAQLTTMNVLRLLG